MTYHPKISLFGILMILNCRHLKNGKCSERLSLNSPYLPEDRSSKKNWVIISPLPRRFIDQGRLTLFFFLILFIYLWLCWVFVSVRGFSLVAASGGHSSSRCAGLSLSRPLLLRSTGSRRTGSAIVARGPSRSEACVIFPDQGSNPCPLH